MASSADWPSLSLDAWKDTYETLHLWTQVVGKIPLRLSPRVNHWWNVALSVTPRGLSTTTIPYGERMFEIELDFIDHALWIRTSEGERRALALAPKTVADFYRELMGLLGSLDIDISIDPMPKEIPNPIPFDQDHGHGSYDPKSIQSLHAILLQSNRVLNQFRSRFIGKCSPVLFYWGTFDLGYPLLRRRF